MTRDECQAAKERCEAGEAFDGDCENRLPALLKCGCPDCEFLGHVYADLPAALEMLERVMNELSACRQFSVVTDEAVEILREWEGRK